MTDISCALYINELGSDIQTFFFLIGKDECILSIGIISNKIAKLLSLPRHSKS